MKHDVKTKIVGVLLACMMCISLVGVSGCGISTKVVPPGTVVIVLKSDGSSNIYTKGSYVSWGRDRVYFVDTKFYGEVNFGSSIFEGDTDFSKAIFNKANFSESTFKSRAYFENITFDLLSFVNCGFRDTTLFKRVDDRNYKGIAIFNFVRFDENTIIDNFPLSKTSFLRTNVRKIMLMEYFEDNNIEKILSHKLLINDYGNEKIYNEAYEILKKYLNNHISVLAEYRNLRLSVEDNITYEEASNLYKMEMELRKENSKFPEKLAIELYEILSNCGESVEKSVLWIILTIALLPLIALLYNYHIIWFIILILIVFEVICLGIPLIQSIYQQTNNVFKFYFLLLLIVIIWTYYTTHNTHIELLIDTITAFFQLSIDDTKNGNYEHFMKNWEVIIRITSLILLGNLYIALRRRLSRK
jgi:hypothetical protein